MNEDRAAAEAFWRKPHTPEWVANYAASAFAPTRRDLGMALRQAAPFMTALDLGCNCGVLVPWLQAAGDDVAITGVDVSGDALARAAADWPDAEWIRASVVDWLPQQVVARRWWDVVVTSSCLAHVTPTDIGAVLAAIAAVARKAIVLQEVCVTPTKPAGLSSGVGVREWRHDYAARLPGHGWQCVETRSQEIDPTRPGAVMVFKRSSRHERTDD